MIKKILVLLLPALLLLGHAASGNAGAKDDSSWPTVALPGPLDVSGFIAPEQPEQPKLDGALAALAEPGEGREDLAAVTGLRLEGGLVQVQLDVDPEAEPDARDAVIAAGGHVTGSLEGVLQAWLPPDALAAVAAEPAVAFVRPPDVAVLADEEALTAVSEGVAAAGADAWHTAGWRGQGVRVAIIDAGFTGYVAKLGSDLPATVTVKNFVDGQSDADVGATTAHGTACAEIVYDMAPLAALYLLKISTDVDLGQAVDYAISQGVDVISTSLTFINVTPGDGTGRFATMAQRARDAGILWVTAAGNYRETHWSGAFVDSDGDGLHEFAPGVEVNAFGPGNDTAFPIAANIALAPSIRWDDWTAVNQDYRLLLMRHNGTTYDIVSSSNNPQTGIPGQRPIERTVYVTSGPPAVYGIAIQRVNSNRDVYFHLLTPNRELDRRVPPMSLGNLADVAPVLTVAAVDVNAPFVREEYSSEGPTNGPGGAPTGGQLKPNLAAFAKVSTASFGTRSFNGTSAATPHVAGAAAQVFSAYPTALPGELQDYLQSRAINQGVPGVDPQFGFGRLHLGAPPGPWDYEQHLFVPFVLVRP